MLLSNQPKNHQETILCQISEQTMMLEQLLLVLLKWKSNKAINGMPSEKPQYHHQEIIMSLTLVKTMTLQIQGSTWQLPKRDLANGSMTQETQRILFSLRLMLTKEKSQTQFVPQQDVDNILTKKLLWDTQLTTQFQTLVEIRIWFQMIDLLKSLKNN